MNCPSRTDDTLEHDEWNQNPPLLAPDLTTCQDFNGMVNVRENQDDGGNSSRLNRGFQWKDVPPFKETEKGNSLPSGRGMTLTLSGHPAPFKAGSQANQEDQYSSNLTPYQTIKSWALWLLSVLCASVLISSSKVSGYLTFAHHSGILETPLEKKRPAPAKRSKCATGGVGGDTYDLPLHVAALFIILATSTIACAFPILATRFPRLRIPPSFLFFVSHFGTGVLIATAFVHLLPTAFTSLGDPCLSTFWTTDYPAMPGAIALGGIFIVTLAEMVFSPAQHICRGGKSSSTKQDPSSGFDKEQPPGRPATTITGTRQLIRSQDQASGLSTLDGRAHLRDMGPLIGRSTSISRAMSRVGHNSEKIVRVASAPEIQTHRETDNGVIHEDIERHDHSFELTPEQKQKKETMQVYLLEMGILFHSVFIGMSLSVSIGNEFVILLIAIVFHQTFEGLALGSRIASLPWSERQLQPWIMSLAYGCTTPIGQAIGLATHTLYSPDSEVGLLLVGVMNAISAGLLIFASLVELMSEDFLSDESWRILLSSLFVGSTFSRITFDPPSKLGLSLFRMFGYLHVILSAMAPLSQYPSLSELLSHLDEVGRKEEASSHKMARTQRDEPHAEQRHEQRHEQRDSRPVSGPSNQNPHLIHPSFTQVTKPFVSEAIIQACFDAMGVSRSREESVRLLGVNWIHSVRKALHLPVRTFNTAVMFYHRFRLIHPDSEFNYVDAAAAALFTACKIEDTLKKSRDIVCTAYNIKVSTAEQLTPDNSVFEGQIRSVIGLERLMLEASGFDFRTHHPQEMLAKLIKFHYKIPTESQVSNLAYLISMDLYRTFAPLKQTPVTLAFSCLELAFRLLDQHLEPLESGADYEKFYTSRKEVMETLLDLLELYTHSRPSTTVGPDFPADQFLKVRIPLNQEARDKQLPRYCGPEIPTPAEKSGIRQRPLHPLTPVAANGDRRGESGSGRDAPLRFILDPEWAEQEGLQVSEFFKVETEEYEIEE
ncbi:Zinc-regulated transporter 2 [Penicillium rolfsii]|nr:Zinc-regulated transporter 2 [Penicillium rolfsii]